MRRIGWLFLLSALTACSGMKSGFWNEHDQSSSAKEFNTLQVPQRMDFPFPGGLQFTWDGRVLLSAGDLNPAIANPETENGRLARQYGLNTGWGLTVFRPEVLETSSAANPFLAPGVFSAATHTQMYPLEYNYPFDEATVRAVGPATFLAIIKRTMNMDLHNSSALVPDPRYSQNPFKSDARGNPVAGGAFETYRFYLITNRWVPANLIPPEALPAGEEWVAGVGLRTGLIVVQNPRTASATVSLARMDAVEVDGRDGRFKPLRDSAGRFIFQPNEYAIEPTATVDGRLIIYQASGGVLKYTFNPVLSDVGWSPTRSVTYMFSDPAVRALYPIAQKPFVRADGRVYQPGEDYKGSYPWISPDGTELFHTASFTDNLPSGKIQRGAATVIGKLTGWVAKHIDGTVNPDRSAFKPGLVTQRVFFYSFGSIPGMWSPYNDTAFKKIPLSTVNGPMYPLVSNQMGQYHEITFEDNLDGEYLAFYRMNELVIPPPAADTSTSYVNTRTPDTSGNFNTGNLAGDAKFPADISPSLDGNPGINGRAIYFGASGVISAQPPADRPNKLVFAGAGLTLQLWIKRTPESAGIARAQSLICLDCTASALNYQLLLEQNGTIRLRAKLANAIRDSGTTPTAIPIDNQWHHVAGVVDGSTGQLSIYIDGNLSRQTPTTAGTINAVSGTLFIGPAGAAGEAPGAGVPIFLLDEVAVSGVARTQRDILLSNYINPATPVVDRTLQLPLGLRSVDLKVPAGRAPTPTEIELGKLLFHDPRLSSNGSVSCATCHIPRAGFTDGLPIARGLNGQQLVRNTPTVVNRAFSDLQFFDGRSSSLEEQALAPIQHPDEMGNFLNGAIAFLQSQPAYVSRFQSAFGTGPSAEGIRRALASFQRSLLSGNSRFDRYESGQLGALTISEINGRNLFFGKARCVTCHTGSNLTDEKFHRTGLNENADNGRMAITGFQRDLRSFKTPTLRDVSKTAPYLHDGSITTLKQVVQLYNQGAPSIVDRDAMIFALGLTSQEEDDLVSFLRTLDGDPAWVDTTTPTLPGGVTPVTTSLTVVGCQIAQGQSTCMATLSSTGPAGAGIRLRPSSQPVTSSTAACAVGQTCQIQLGAGTYIATLHSTAGNASSSVLRTTQFDVQPPAPVVTNTLTVTGCSIPAGATSCGITVSSQAPGFPSAGIRARASGQTLAQSIFLCAGACSLPAPAGTFIITLHAVGADPNSAVLDTKTITVGSASNPTPSGTVAAAGCEIPTPGATCNVTITATAQNAPNAGVRARLVGAPLSQSSLVCVAPSCAIAVPTAGTYVLTLHLDRNDFNSAVLATANVDVTQRVVANPTGALTVASCTIAAGSTTCPIQVSSSVQNAPSAGVRGRIAGQPISSSISICGVGACSIPVAAGSYILTLHAVGSDLNSAILDTKTVTVAVAAPTASGTITGAAGCQIPSPGASCSVTMSATAQNAPLAGIRARLSNAPLSSSVIACVAPSCSIPVSTVGTYILTLHLDRNDFNSTILSTASVDVTQAAVAAPMGSLTVVGCTISAGTTSCPAQISSVVQNAPSAGVRARTSGQAIGASMQIGGVGAFSIAAPAAATYIVTLHVNGADPNSAILDTKNLVVMSNVYAPTGAVEQADGAVLRGWAGDQDNMTAAATVYVVVDNEATARYTTVANLAHAVGAHGFSIPAPISTLRIPAGTHNIKIYVDNLNSAGTPVGTPVLIWQANFTL